MVKIGEKIGYVQEIRREGDRFDARIKIAVRIDDDRVWFDDAKWLRAQLGKEVRITFEVDE